MKRWKKALHAARRLLGKLNLGKARRKLAKRRATRKQKTRDRKRLLREREQIREKLERQHDRLDQVDAESDEGLAIVARIAELEEQEADLTRAIERTRTRIGSLTAQIADFAKKVRRRERKRRKLRKRIQRAKKRIAEIKERSSLGTGPWAGTQSIIEQIVVREYEKAGVPVTSRKRWETYGNPDSDHWMGNPDAYAADGGTANNRDLAFKVAAAIMHEADEVSGSYTGDYDSFNVRFGNRSFRIQIIYGTHGTGPHIHSGAAAI